MLWDSTNAGTKDHVKVLTLNVSTTQFCSKSIEKLAAPFLTSSNISPMWNNSHKINTGAAHPTALSACRFPCDTGKTVKKHQMVSS